MADDHDLLGGSRVGLAFKLVGLALFGGVAWFSMGMLGVPFIAGFIGLVFATEFRELFLWGAYRLPRAYLRDVGEHRLYTYCGSDVRVLLGEAPEEAWFHEDDVLAAFLLAPPPGLSRFSPEERVRLGKEDDWYFSVQGLERLMRYYVKSEEASRFRAWLKRDVFLKTVASLR